MVAQRIRRQARAYTLFKLLVLIGIGAFIAYLILIEGALDQILNPEPAALPMLTTPPSQFDEGDAVELSGTGEPGDLIRIFANDEPVGETVVSPTGRWQFTTFELSQPGDYTVRVAPVLDSGQVQYIEAPQTFTLTIVDPYPSATIEDAEQIGGTDEPVVRLSGTGTPNSTILITQDGQLLGVAETRNTGRWDLETTLPTLSLDNIILETLDSENRSIDISPAYDLNIDPLPEPEAMAPTSSEEASQEASEDMATEAETETEIEIEIETADETAEASTETPEETVEETNTAETSSAEAEEAVSEEEETETTTTAAPSPDTTNTPEPQLTLTEETVPDQNGQLTIQGTAAPNSTVEILLNGELADTVETDENGEFTTTVNLAEFGENDLVTRSVEEDGTVIFTSEPIIYTFSTGQ